jgi:capsular polysaccharide biosynthesis protein
VLPLSLTEYTRILVRRGWIMLLLAILIAAGAYLLTRDQTPVYEATQAVLIQPSRADLGLTQATFDLLAPLISYLDSDQIAQRIITDLGLDILPGQLRANTEFAADQFRLTIKIAVESTDQAFAARAAEGWGQVLVDYRNERNQLARREDRVDAILIDAPQIGQIAPRPRINALAGGVVGLILGAAIIFVLEFMESSFVRRRDDLERGLDITVLAAVPGHDA